MFVTAGAINRSIYFYVVGDASHASPGDPITGLLFSDIETGGSASYVRQGAARVDLTLITLASASAVHADGGFILVDDTNMPGVYRCDYPDAAFATGVDQAACQLVIASAKNAVAAPILIDISDFDLRDAVRGGLTALPNAAADAAGGLPISDAGGLALDTQLANTNEITVARMGALTDWIDGGRLDSIIDLILVDTGTTLDTKINNMQGATFDTATDSLEALRNRGDSAWTGAPPTVHTGTAQAGAANSITLDAGASATDELYTLLRVSITSGTGTGQSRAINGYTGATKVATVVNSWAVNPDATSGFEVVSDAITEITAAPTAAVIADAIWDENTTGHTTSGTFGEQCKNDIDAILADTGELQADWVDGGRLDLIIDAILVDTGTTLDAAIAVIDANVDAVLVDTGELQTDWVDGGRLDLILDARAAEATVAALNNITVASILTTQMTESYAADGAAPTLAQGIMLIQQLLSDFAISGTTLSIKQLDGTTEAATLTLNSSTTPTSATRAT